MLQPLKRRMLLFSILVATLSIVGAVLLVRSLQSDVLEKRKIYEKSIFETKVKGLDGDIASVRKYFLEIDHRSESAVNAAFGANPFLLAVIFYGDEGRKVFVRDGVPDVFLISVPEGGKEIAFTRRSLGRSCIFWRSEEESFASLFFR